MHHTDLPSQYYDVSNINYYNYYATTSKSDRHSHYPPTDFWVDGKKSARYELEVTPCHENVANPDKLEVCYKHKVDNIGKAYVISGTYSLGDGRRLSEAMDMDYYVPVNIPQHNSLRKVM